MSEEPHCLVERRGHVLVVTMNRPEARNALSAEMMNIMRAAWDQVLHPPTSGSNNAQQHLDCFMAVQEFGFCAN